MNKDTNQIMALINAYRMDGLGNNFIIIDRRKNVLEISKDKIVSIANKKIIFQENKQKNISIKTKERVLSAEVVGEKNVKINMGKPKFGWEEVPLSESMNTKQVSIDLLEKEHGNGFCLNVGNPHIIFFVEDCSKIDIKKLGPKIENYRFFPERTNVTFAQVLDKKNIKVNVWERGAGQTKACGTAACAVTDRRRFTK